MFRRFIQVSPILILGIIIIFLSSCASFPSLWTREVQDKTISQPITEDEELMETVIPEVIVPEISLMAVGDVMLARKLDSLIHQKGMDYPFLNMSKILSSADIAFANLESPLSDKGKEIVGKGIWFRGRPENIDALIKGNFDVISIANNHALDYDSPAFLQTIDILKTAGMEVIGGGENINAARRPAILERKGIKIAFLAYSEMADIVWSYEHPRRLKATEEIPGIAPLVLMDIMTDVEKIKDQVDYVFLSLHWGVEYADMPENYQIELAHQLIDAGVDVILGHHPHCLQGVELYHGGLIVYSLGNFVFDQNWSDKTREGLLLSLKMDPAAILSAELIPIFIDDGQPVVAEDEKSNRILQRTQKISEQLGTKLTIEQGTGVIINDDGNGQALE